MRTLGPYDLFKQATWRDVCIGVGLFVLLYLVLIGYFAATAGAQTPYRVRAWKIGEIFGIPVGVIDTGNVCIYVTDDVGSPPGAGRAIAVLPKRNQSLNVGNNGTTGSC